MKKTGLVLVGHGSRLEGFERAMLKVARRLRRKRVFSEVRCAYLEITPPSIAQAVDEMIQREMEKVFILPYFLLKGRHTQEDIPAHAKALRSKYKKKAKIILCPYLGYHAALADIVCERVREAR